MTATLETTHPFDAARSRAIADVEYPIEVTLAEAYKGAERVLELQDQDGRALTVNVAKPREERPRSGGGGNRGGSSRY